jgi:hypothetical protein
MAAPGLDPGVDSAIHMQLNEVRCLDARGKPVHEGDRG